MAPSAMSKPTAAQLSNSSEGRGKPVEGRALAIGWPALAWGSYARCLTGRGGDRGAAGGLGCVAACKGLLLEAPGLLDDGGGRRVGVDRGLLDGRLVRLRGLGELLAGLPEVLLRGLGFRRSGRLGHHGLQFLGFIGGQRRLGCGLWGDLAGKGNADGRQAEAAGEQEASHEARAGWSLRLSLSTGLMPC